MAWIDLPTQTRLQIETYARTHMGVEPGHDYGHVRRVANWAVRLAHEEGYPRPGLAEAAGLLHDVGLSSCGADRRRHGEMGAALARDFLLSIPVFSPDDTEEIVNAIRHHVTNRTGSGMLLDILRDADMMEFFGPFGLLRGVARASHKPVCYSGLPRGETWGMSSTDFDRRFDDGRGIGPCLVDDINFQASCYGNLATRTARRWAEPYVQFMRDFVLMLERQAADAGEWP